MKLIDLMNAEFPHTVMGVDASTKSIAYAVIVDGELIEYDKKYLGDGSIGQKCKSALRIAKDLNERFSPDIMLVESAVYVNNRQVVINLAYVFGAFMAGFADCPIEQVSPSTWLKHIGNDVKANKKTKADILRLHPDKSDAWVKKVIREKRKLTTISILNQKYDIINEDDDIADAIAIATYGHDTKG